MGLLQAPGGGRIPVAQNRALWTVIFCPKITSAAVGFVVSYRLTRDNLAATLGDMTPGQLFPRLLGHLGLYEVMYCHSAEVWEATSPLLAVALEDWVDALVDAGILRRVVHPVTHVVTWETDRDTENQWRNDPESLMDWVDIRLYSTAELDLGTISEERRVSPHRDSTVLIPCPLLATLPTPPAFRGNILCFSCVSLSPVIISPSCPSLVLCLQVSDIAPQRTRQHQIAHLLGDLHAIPDNPQQQTPRQVRLIAELDRLLQYDPNRPLEGIGGGGVGTVTENAPPPDADPHQTFTANRDAANALVDANLARQFTHWMGHHKRAARYHEQMVMAVGLQGRVDSAYELQDTLLAGRRRNQ